MESRVKIFGHPIHPILVTLPIGLFTMAVVSDILYLATVNELFPIVAFFNISGGILGGLLAMIFGYIDYAALPENTRAKRIGLFHGFGNLIVLVLFSISWSGRANIEGYIPSALALFFGFGAFLIAAFTAWLGGELVDRLGVGVDAGANLDAPNSMSGKSATAHFLDQIPVTGGEEHVEDEP
jgi:uncharacterized membrane protein